ncbi:cytochrome P450 [Streptomyces sp. V4I23]|uniref:cytochrome P450 n=1 Tax=Streptomyces sp. V4I23 TaxID=3042282 RepID=UPI0027821CFD|nr:cytochrome P450 [Streptomyces sp. V4I23]MDQ1005636.1 cytochrome P450 [Streptomyces sp. V4I23]
MNWAFAPVKTANAFTPRIQELVDELIDGFAMAGKCEFIRQFASPLPIQVIGSVLGVPESDIGMLKAWSDDFAAVQCGNIPHERLVQVARSVVESQEYFLAQLEERRREPRDDLLGRMIRPPNGESPLEVPELLDLINQIMVAGNETTTAFLGNAMYLLATTEALTDQLDDTPALIPNLIEEVLRLETVLPAQYRTTTEDVEISGTRVPAGAKIAVLFASANRDESYYDEKFKPDRENWPVPHMGFGRGIHACIGQALARREGEIAIERLVKRLTDFRIDPDRLPVRTHLFGLRGLVELHLRFRPRYS